MTEKGFSLLISKTVRSLSSLGNRICEHCKKNSHVPLYLMTVFVYFPQNTVMNGECCRMNKTGNLSSGITGEREQNENIILKY